MNKDKHNKQAKDLKNILKSYIKKSFLEKINENDFLNSKYFFILLGIIIFSIYIYYSPSKEFISCNSNYECSYEREYFGIFKIQKQYLISKNSYMEVKTKNVYRSGYLAGLRDYHSYPVIINIGGEEISPFVYYYKSSSDEEDAYNSLNNEIEKFKNYMINPSNTYKINMNTNPIIFIIFFSIFLFLYIAFYIKWFVGNDK